GQIERDAKGRKRRDPVGRIDEPRRRHDRETDEEQCAERDAPQDQRLGTGSSQRVHDLVMPHGGRSSPEFDSVITTRPRRSPLDWTLGARAVSRLSRRAFATRKIVSRTERRATAACRMATRVAGRRRTRRTVAARRRAHKVAEYQDL